MPLRIAHLRPWIITMFALAAPLAPLAVSAQPRGQATPSVAEIPNYDPQRHCSRSMNVLNVDSEFMLRACLTQEQNSYDLMKARWSEIGERIRRHCIGSNRTLAMESYFMLNACVSQEESSSRQNQQFEFRR